MVSVTSSPGMPLAIAEEGGPNLQEERCLFPGIDDVEQFFALIDWQHQRRCRLIGAVVDQPIPAASRASANQPRRRVGSASRQACLIVPSSGVSIPSAVRSPWIDEADPVSPVGAPHAQGAR